MFDLTAFAGPSGLLAWQGPSLAMLAAALMLRRSLGSWPPLLAAGGACGLVQVARLVAGGALDGLPATSAMLLPTILFLLARQQVIPGLRRGQMTEMERQRWIVQHAIPAKGGQLRLRQP